MYKPNIISYEFQQNSIIPILKYAMPTGASSLIIAHERVKKSILGKTLSSTKRGSTLIIKLSY